jgi:hypothetical protein
MRLLLIFWLATLRLIVCACATLRKRTKDDMEEMWSDTEHDDGPAGQPAGAQTPVDAARSAATPNRTETAPSQRPRNFTTTTTTTTDRPKGSLIKSRGARQRAHEMNQIKWQRGEGGPSGRRAQEIASIICARWEHRPALARPRRRGLLATSRAAGRNHANRGASLGTSLTNRPAAA